MSGTPVFDESGECRPAAMYFRAGEGEARDVKPESSLREWKALDYNVFMSRRASAAWCRRQRRFPTGGGRAVFGRMSGLLRRGDTPLPTPVFFLA
jgi:hypothetical protein